MKRLFFSLASLLCTIISYSQNPIIQTKYTADPAPLVYNDTVFLYTSHDEDDAFGFKMKDWLLYTSTDMVNWTDRGVVASLKDFKWVPYDNGAWAPQCVHRNNKFYLYCPMPNGIGIGVLVSESPYGPFIDPIGKPLIKNGIDDIDPTVFIDDDGQAYLYWGNPNLYYVKLNEDMISYSGGITKDSSFAKIKGQPDPFHYQEGPWAYKRNGHYYMAYASTCCPEGIGYAMSNSPTGPWTYKGAIMAGDKRSSGNHPGIIDYKGNSYVFGFNLFLLRQTMAKHSERRSISLATLTYNADGTIQQLPFWTAAGVKQLETLNPYRQVEAETIAFSEGVKTEQRTEWERDAPYNKGKKIIDRLFITSINNGDYIKVGGVNFDKGVSSVDVNVASLHGGNIELHTDSINGPLLTTITVTGTAEGDNWKTVNTPVKKSIKGVHDLYFVFKGEKELFLFDWWRCNAVQTGAQTVWLDELDLSAATQGYGVPGKNKTVDGKTMTIAGKTFQRGVGTHAVSSLSVILNGKARSFTAQVGIDDEITGHEPAVEFELYGDGKKLWSSGIMRLGDAARECNVTLTGVQKLELVVTDGGNGNYYDHANWADARFEANGVTRFATYNPIASEPYILTPKAPEWPRINGSTVFGVRPGSPFQYRIAATGKRPMSFSATGLPAGLQLDAKTGIITGVLTAKGTYIVTLGASNTKGKADKKLRIVCGDKIALTPPMGWNSWNCFAGEVSADKVKRATDAMLKSGLADHGWNYINIDDFWQNHRDSKDSTIRGQLRDEKGYIVPNSRFKDMKGLADYVHNAGLKIGLYSSPGPWTCGGCAGSYNYEKQDAEKYAEWGFDYLKYDWCSYGGVINGMADNDPYKVSSLSYRGGNELNTAIKPFKLMGDYLRQQPRDIVFSLCQYGMSDVWKWGDSVGGSCWRTTNDITDTWTSVKNIALEQDKSAAWAKPGNWNDPDMLVVGTVGWGRPHPSKLKPDEQYLHISLWSLFSAPLLIGCDMEKLDDFTLNLLTNDEVIAIDQDPLGRQATCKQTIGELKIYVKELEDGSRAVGFCNFGSAPVNMSYKDFDKLGIRGSQQVRDVWRQKDIVRITTGKTLPVSVPAHGVLLYKFSAVK